jgi:hypothetical protein
MLGSILASFGISQRSPLVEMNGQAIFLRMTQKVIDIAECGSVITRPVILPVADNAAHQADLDPIGA